MATEKENNFTKAMQLVHHFETARTEEVRVQKIIDEFEKVESQMFTTCKLTVVGEKDIVFPEITLDYSELYYFMEVLHKKLRKHKSVQERSIENFNFDFKLREE